MKTHKRSFMCILFLSLSVPVWATPANELTQTESVSLSGYPLSLKEATQLAIAHNFDIAIERLKRTVTEKEIQKARAIYDTTLTGSAGYTHDEEEPTSTSSPSTEKKGTWNLGASKKFAWGSLVSLSFLNTRTSASPASTVTNPYYTSDLVASIEQPIVKNSFGFLDRASVRLVELDVSRLDLEILNRIESAIAETQKQYWDLVYALQAYQAQQQALAAAEHFYTVTQQQYEDGAAEETDLFAAEAQAYKKRNDASEAYTAYLNASEDLKFAMNFFPAVSFRPTDEPAIETLSLTPETHINESMEHNRTYKAAALSLEAKNLIVRMKKNSRLPQIDLLGTLTANGLSREMLNAIGEASGAEDPTYFVGVQASFPLENRKARAEYTQASLEKAQAILRLTQTEKEITTSINKNVRLIADYQKQVSHYKTILELQRKKLEGEDRKYKNGRSSSDLISRYQDDVVLAHIALARAFTQYNKTLINLQQIKNTLLDTVDWIAYEENT